MADVPAVASWLLRPSSMIAWMKDKLQQFYTLPARIAALRAAADTVMQRAQEQGKPQLASAVQGIINHLGITASNQVAVQSRVTVWLSDLGRAGVSLPTGTMGALPPLKSITDGAVLAVSIASLFTDVGGQVRDLSVLARQVMSPEDADRLIQSGGTPGVALGSVWKPLAWVAGIAAVVYVVKRRRRRR